MVCSGFWWQVATCRRTSKRGDGTVRQAVDRMRFFFLGSTQQPTRSLTQNADCPCPPAASSPGCCSDPFRVQSCQGLYPATCEHDSQRRRTAGVVLFLVVGVPNLSVSLLRHANLVPVCIHDIRPSTTHRALLTPPASGKPIGRKPLAARSGARLSLHTLQKMGQYMSKCGTSSPYVP